ncbi:flagellar basal body rod protein FlgC [Oceanibacterium hippocampi]|uniref:Flagellar basal-body rod protein FlgC n=1 Tax=Oceanibacterium hippocampi TaxID=745714 RepID=A0A1Y5TYX2_9PROT|nr:flagellar basal body rod protein FlgC [Oceanibacterium hippocampi]SLN76822.1 Flagellar basal-body rod protein FlgC [Oceanibacterium hippocampi]
MDFSKTLMISASGMKAQSERMRVIAENVANKDSLAKTPGENPYRRKVVVFKNALDRELGVSRVEVAKVTRDRSDFGLEYRPGHPAADENGYVRTPNVHGLIEMIDMKEAQRSYEANLNLIDAAKAMLMKTIEILR